ncbi:glycoside hydrolase family 92 protein [Baudoinia panamericana UAMH 10762]|uniref:Glycoside hydrolase family 92 protein n=1 Tax=Baudoinia panamericana (strain UAMH 10762) TaxID=717646 RepID=M2LV24_BAUPA|nr:glycoside hydrolase family 92 protein [Baudoinia panamericana UAMH 10762]EMC98467.1 glycoside hydrolase family 92 protein [Baudoinia panamericana UAMH 10762]
MTSVNFRLGTLIWLSSLVVAQVDYSQYVNPFIGSEGPFPGLAFGGGDIFVGAALPFGVVKVGIDTYEQNVSFSTLNGGYTPQGRVTAISMMHESGTGGAPKYGIVPQMPLAGSLATVNVLDNTTYWQQRVGNDTANVGYYATKLESGVSVQLSASRHSGIMEYAFPAGDKHILVDLSHYLPSETGGSDVQFYVGGEMDLQPGGQIYTGYTTIGGGWSESAPMTVYFCGEFDHAPDQANAFSGRLTDPIARYHTWSDGPVPQATFGNLTETAGPLNNRVGALFTWSNASVSTIKSRVGISFISADKACAFKNSEIRSWNLNDTVQAAVSEWNQDVFSKIRVPTDSTQNRTNLILLYSSLYFMHLMPSDRTGENPLWPNIESYWDDFYTLWDIFRCTVSLYHLIQPTYYQGMIRALIDIWRWEGFMPDGRSGNYNGLVQGGSNADNVLADAYVKGLPGINWTAAYQAMLKDAEVVPYNTFSYTDFTASVKEGRGALYDWIPLGYVSSDRSTRAISRSVEYALNDFSLSQVARGVAPNDTQKYLARSAQWQNIWNANVTHKNFTGFLAPRLSNGTFNLTDYNPALCGGCEWQSITYEGTPFEYSFTIPHDMQTLIQFMGGSAEFERRLDYIFQPNTSEQNLGANGAGITTLMNIGNEPDFATPYEYNYVGKQYKSVMRARSLANQYFHNANYGVPGNSDAGALNSWLIWQMLGLYPVVTQPVYLIQSPWFPDINMTINGNATLRIMANGLDNANSYYVQSVTVNGRPWTQNWLSHGDVMVNGGTIVFQMGSQQTMWESGNVPPSPGHYTL